MTNHAVCPEEASTSPLLVSLCLGLAKLAYKVFLLVSGSFAPGIFSQDTAVFANDNLCGTMIYDIAIVTIELAQL